MRLCLNMVTFYAVRHGETDANKNGVLQGHLDVPLSREGQRQAGIVARALFPIKLDAVYSSDLSRAQETAHAIMKGRPCSLILDKRLREIHVGSLSGLTSEEAHKKFPEYHAILAKDPYHVRRPGGGESRMDLRDRISRVLSDIYDWHRHRVDARIGVVSHGGVINALLNIALAEVEWPGFTVANCSITILERDDEGWRVLKMNDCEHFSRLGEKVYLPPDPGGN